MAPSLTEAERETLERGRAAHPQLDPDRSTLIEVYGSAALTQALEGEQAADFYLVCAALAGDDKAVERVRKRIRGTVRAIDGVDAEDIAQRCWLRLFSAERRVLRYAGRGSLDALFRVTTTRLGLNTARDAPKEASLEAAFVEAELEMGPETLLAATQYRGAFEDGLQRAVDALPDEERLLLRLHAVDRLSIDELAVVLGVHRATAARRLERARGRVAEGVRAALRETLGEAGVQDSLLRRVRSQLDLSLSRLLT